MDVFTNTSALRLQLSTLKSCEYLIEIILLRLYFCVNFFSLYLPVHIYPATSSIITLDQNIISFLNLSLSPRTTTHHLTHLSKFTYTLGSLSVHLPQSFLSTKDHDSVFMLNKPIFHPLIKSKT